MKRLLVMLFNFKGQIYLKWKDGELSKSSYVLNEACYMLDNMTGYEYAQVKGGWLDNFKFI